MFLTGTAEIVEEGVREYRYNLTRQWNKYRRRLCFVMLNPSTANAVQDDPTIRRCLGFAQRWNYGSLEVVNLFALITPYPEELEAVADPIGRINDLRIARAVIQADTVVAAWGNFKQANKERTDKVLSLIFLYKECHCLGICKNGAPRHPLYLKKDTPLIPLQGLDRNYAQNIES